MDYLEYKKNYPLTITLYMEWLGNKVYTTSNSFSSFLEYFYDTDCSVGVAEEYYEILIVEKESIINILESSGLPLSYNDNGIIFNLNGQLDDALKSVEYILSKRIQSNE